MDHLRIDIEYSVMWLDALADVEFPGWGESAPTVRMRRGESIRLVYATKEEFDREPWFTLIELVQAGKLHADEAVVNRWVERVIEIPDEIRSPESLARRQAAIAASDHHLQPN